VPPSDPPTPPTPPSPPATAPADPTTESSRPGAAAADRADYRVNMGRASVPPALNDPQRRLEWNLPESVDELGDYMIELNLLHRRGIEGAASRFIVLYKEAVTDRLQADQQPQGPAPVRIAKTYYTAKLTVVQWRALMDLDEKCEPPERAIYRLWPDFPVQALIDRSVATVKGDAAQRAFAASGGGIVWAVIDSGIDAGHPHFGLTEEEAKPLGVKARHTLRAPEVADLHRDFSLADPDADPNLGEPQRQALLAQHKARALADECGHGTHVAGIIAGGLPARSEEVLSCRFFERHFDSNQDGDQVAQSVGERTDANPAQFHGVAPDSLLVSLKVLDAKGRGRTSAIIRALDYVRDKLNANPKLLRVHGVNLSVGYEFDAEMFACGQSPLCVEVDRLVQAGVVVVTAAGNTGYSILNAISAGRTTRVGLANTINDPGNAALAVTVGATHRDSPHTYGVSYFSSKGPTGDGRLKPDLVAPGERITSCAAGQKLADIRAKVGGTDLAPVLAPAGAAKDAAAAAAPPPRRLAAYIDDSGTSMAAPHVSGAMAAFLSIRREFIGKPLEVKKIFVDSATTLGRERYFEGNGLVDLMRAIQLV
jgi:subtilisin family serine protease